VTIRGGRDCRVRRSPGPDAGQYGPAHNAQAVTDDTHIVIASEMSADSPDFGHLGPMVAAAEHE
jgi:hypothetical protein